jgi:rhodanese-related sulfurtransferase
MNPIFDLENLLLLGGLMMVLSLMVFVRRLRQAGPEIAPEALLAKIEEGQDILVLDVRTPEEFRGEMGHIRRALNFPLQGLEARLKELGGDLEPHKAAPVAVVCRTQSRSAQAARLLLKAGFTNVMLVSGGMARWKANGLPITRE